METNPGEGGEVSEMGREGRNGAGKKPGWEAGGSTGWLMGRLKALFRSADRERPRLALLERIALAPRQSLALVEAEGRRFLVATSADGAPAFYALDEGVRGASAQALTGARGVKAWQGGRARPSW